MTKHIAVLMGGWSAEREVSLNSGVACGLALQELGYQVTTIDVQPDIAAVLAQVKPDIVFNALHGQYGEDGCIQGLLEILKIPYTHSGVLASALAMDKPMAKKLFASVGLHCPRGQIMSRAELLEGDPMPRPYVVKPANEGSSVGVHIVMPADNRPISRIMGEERRGEASEHSLATRHVSPATYLVEEYIPGREITVAVLDDRALGVTEIRPKQGFYDYANKYTDGYADHLCPAPLPSPKYEEALRMALAAHQVLGCRGLSRADFRYNDAEDHGELYLLELNTQPGMTSLSLSPEIALHAGISFNALVEALVQGARLGG